MAGGLGNNLAVAYLNDDHGSGTPATLYYGLLTAQPTDGDASSLVEAAWSGYARPSLTNSGTNWPGASVVSHIAQTTSGSTASISWGTLPGGASTQVVTGLAECSSLTASFSASNMIRTAVFGTISSPVTYTLNAGASLSIPGTNLTFQQT